MNVIVGVFESPGDENAYLIKFKGLSNLSISFKSFAGATIKLKASYKESFMLIALSKKYLDR